MPPRRRPAQAAPPAAADPDTALVHVRHAEAVVRALKRQDAEMRARAAAQFAESAAKLEAARADLQAAQTAARAAARVARRAGRALAYATHPSALPADVLLHIASFLPPSDGCSMAGTCTDWRAALLASPSPIFRSVRVRFKDLLKSGKEMPLAATLKSRAPDVMALELVGPTTKRDHAWAASLLPSFARLTSLTYKTSTQRGSWIGTALLAAATSCPALVSINVDATSSSPPSPADIFRTVGAALSRLTAVSYESGWRVPLDAGYEQRGTPWLEPATALRELTWKADVLPVLPATLALHTLKLSEKMHSVPPAALTPGLRSVRRIEMCVRPNVLAAFVRRATRLTCLDTSKYYASEPISPLVASLSSLRELSWRLSTPDIMPAAALPALSALRLRAQHISTIAVAPGTLDAFAALRSLHIKVYGAYNPSASLTMPALGPNFAPRLTELKLGCVAFDLATVAMTWQAESLRDLTLKSVKLIVNAANVPDNVEADGALGAARAAATAAAAAHARSLETANDAAARLDGLTLLAADEDGEPTVFRTEDERAAYQAAVVATAAAEDAESGAAAAQDAAVRRVDECVDETIARSLPAALPAVTRVVCTDVSTEPWATAAAGALDAFNRRRRRADAGPGPATAAARRAARGGRRAGE